MAYVIQEDVNAKKWFKIFDDDDSFAGLAVSRIDGSKLMLDSISIIDGKRGNGIGGMLLDAVKDWGMQNGCSEIQGDFFPEELGGELEGYARRFYAKNGINIDSENNLKGRLR